MSVKTLIILAGIPALIAVIVAIDLRLRGNKYRPLSAHQPKMKRHRDTRKPELGMEAIDMDLVDEVNAENEAIERGNYNRIRGMHPDRLDLKDMVKSWRK